MSRRPIFDSDSELSEDEPVPIVSDHKLETSKRARPTYYLPSESEPDDSDIQSKSPKKKRARGSKRQSSGKGDKGLQGEVADEDPMSGDDEKETEKSKSKSKIKGKPKGLEMKKELLAEEVVWKDIPDWGNKTDCPLLDLPVEILDRCFSPDTGLDVSVLRRTIIVEGLMIRS
jgi:hypothetical protein